MKDYLLLLTLMSLSLQCNHNVKEVDAGNSRVMSDTKPNVIVIVVDDAGYVDFGFMGSEDLETPEIDQLAAEGVVFTDAHVSATVCAPSRAGIMTGKYQQRFGFEANGTGYGGSGDIGLSDDVTTMSSVFRDNDYNTVAIGKWHLGGESSDHPNNRGFNNFYGFTGGSRSYFPLDSPSKKAMLQRNGEQVSFDGYLTDAFGDEAVRFVEANNEDPFFMYLSFNAVHTPMEAKAEDLKKYKDHPRAELAAMTWSLDENIGKLRRKLKELNQLDNTLIIFLSDNGGATENQSNNGHLKGWKGNKFEGGQRVPFILSWPDRVTAGTFDGLTSSLDIFKTSISAADLKVNDELPLDGVDLMPYVTKEKSGHPHESLYWRKLEESAIRKGDYKLIKLQNYGSVMYNLSSDLSEKENIAQSDTVMFNHLSSELEKWEMQMSYPLWAEEKEWMDVTYHIHRRLMQNKKAQYKTPVSRVQYLTK